MAWKFKNILNSLRSVFSSFPLQIFVSFHGRIFILVLAGGLQKFFPRISYLFHPFLHLFPFLHSRAAWFRTWQVENPNEILKVWDLIFRPVYFTLFAPGSRNHCATGTLPTRTIYLRTNREIQMKFSPRFESAITLAVLPLSLVPL